MTRRAPRPEPRPDFEIANHGSIIGLRPMNDRARDWLQENTNAEPWQWFGGMLCMDPRCASILFAGLQEDGFTLR